MLYRSLGHLFCNSFSRSAGNSLRRYASNSPDSLVKWRRFPQPLAAEDSIAIPIHSTGVVFQILPQSRNFLGSIKLLAELRHHLADMLTRKVKRVPRVKNILQLSRCF